MRPELRHFGTSRCPVVIIDDFSGDVERIAKLADDLAPFPPSANYYPGVRRVIAEDDGPAWAYVRETCEQASQFLAGAFGIDGFTLHEASFSVVTARPEDLQPPQRAPHFDSTDPNYFALLHYLRIPDRTGTAFYRQRSTGIEQVTDANLAAFVSRAEADAAMLSLESGYVDGSDAYFEQIGAVEGIADRMVIYRGCHLHSGIIPKDMNFSSDPRVGRLTANLFVQGYSK